MSYGRNHRVVSLENRTSLWEEKKPYHYYVGNLINYMVQQDKASSWIGMATLLGTTSQT